MADSSTSDLAARIDRLESLEQIRQLASRYALSVDMRDFDALVNLYTEDTRISKTERGRQALKGVFAKVMRQFSVTSHQIGNHVIDFDGADHADGVVYCHAEHEIAGQWWVMQMLYVDRYTRVDGRWYFQWRLPCSLYGVDVTTAPSGPHKLRWPGRAPEDGLFHAPFPSFDAFAKDVLAGEVPLRPINVDRFIESMRQGQPLPKFPTLL